MAPGSWGVELWDQSDMVFKHSADQISSIDMLFRMLSDIQKLQHDFGKKLRKTVISYMPKKKANTEDTTYSTSLSNLIESLSNIGAVYEKGAKDLGDVVVGVMKELYDNERKEYDSQRVTHGQSNNALEQNRKQLDMAWQKYVLAYKEKQKAFDNSIRADNDMQLPRAEQLKARKIYNDKSHAFDQVQGQYAEELSKYNKNLRNHYSKNLVDVLESVQLRDLYRMDRTKELLTKMCDLRDDLSNEVSEANRKAREAICSMDPSKDSEFLIRRYKSGEMPPVDLPFLDLARCRTSLFDGPIQQMGAYLLGIDPSQPCTQLSASGISSTGSTTGGGSMLGGLKLGKGGKEDYANLRNPFICDISTRGVRDTDLTVMQLTERIRELQDRIQKTDAELQGAQRMMESYHGNPAFGSSDTVKPKIEVLKHRLQSLQDLTKQLEDRYTKVGGDQALSEARARMSTLHTGTAQPGGVRDNSNTGLQYLDSDNSLDSDVENDGGSVGVTSSSTIPPPPSLTATGESDTSKYMGIAVAKYEYAGNGSAYLATQPGERFHVLQLDKGNTGWTSVISEDGTRQGFVPTSFMEITMN